MRFNYAKIFLLGFGFFGVSVIWSIYNAFVPVFLADKFHLQSAFIGFFMTLDNIAALFIQPPVGAWSDRLRTPLADECRSFSSVRPLGQLPSVSYRKPPSCHYLSLAPAPCCLAWLSGEHR